jgi:hypothetical protein
MRDEFIFADGSTETPKEDLRAMDRLLQQIDGERGKVYNIDGFRCLCIHPWASYGGGARSLWAVEGHSAQLTLREQYGYIKGKCLTVSETPPGISFQLDPYYSKRDDWVSEGGETIGDSGESKGIKFLSLDEIQRYDFNWW